MELYQSELQNKIDTLVPFQNEAQEVTLERIKLLIDNLQLVVEFYYEGRVLDASEQFNRAMQNLFFSSIKPTLTITVNTTLYRARIEGEHAWKKNDLFHVPFQKRNFVSTNRYSIPGFPALYLGDSTYVCWEEYNRYRLRDLYFSKFSNNRPLTVINIESFNDFKRTLNKYPIGLRLPYLLRYIVTFPLTIACTRKVLEQKGNFKPEYIIPQLLLQFVSAKFSHIDGIRFPSSKVNYNNLKWVNAYNYVFPVKCNKKEGFCDQLMDTFYLTQPTSLELEEISDNPRFQTGIIMGSGKTDMLKIKLAEDVEVAYVNTSFGKLESILSRRPLKRLIDLTA